MCTRYALSEYNVCLVPQTAVSDQSIIRICQSLNILVSQVVIYDLLSFTLVVYHLAFVRRAKRYTRLERLLGIDTGVEDWEEQVVDKEKAGEDKEGKEETDCREEELMEDTRGKVEGLVCWGLEGKKKLQYGSVGSKFSSSGLDIRLKYSASAFFGE